MIIIFCYTDIVSREKRKSKEEEKKMDMRNWDLFDKLVETLGGEELAEELIRYMDSDTANRYLESMARDYEIEDEESED